jgi:putative OPT family oligopeptide transporter
LILGNDSEKGPAAAILIGAVVCCAAAIAGDNMQDLKAGHILGATPQKQQIMQMVGVVSAALVMPLVLQLLLTGYGFGPATEAQPDSLQAPQATLMQSVAEGVFSGDLPWTMVYIGMAIGAAIIILDVYLEKIGSDFRVPVLAVAVGIYLPFELDSAIMVGGVIAWLVTLYQKANRNAVKDVEAQEKASEGAGLLFASGLITGEALLGILLAVPVAIYGTSDVLSIADDPFGSTPGLIIVLAICYILYRMAANAFTNEEKD